ncbi:hypothetical protein ACFXDH_17160 [Streptomyces sp. NPDC059467]|uniref:hypothetical protein n=1 Tax=Streptomyces sp. NPDC059467 TaxID=3346844 RepID=UPI0036A97C5C
MITDQRVDEILPDLQAEGERHETHTPGRREALQRLVLAQREVRNTPDGYWVAGTDPESAHHGLTGTTKLDDVRSAAVMSDGVSRLVTEYGMATWDEVFAALQAGGPRELIETVRKVEATDPTGIRWPGYKSGDDATVAFCQWWPGKTGGRPDISGRHQPAYTCAQRHTVRTMSPASDQLGSPGGEW